MLWLRVFKFLAFLALFVSVASACRFWGGSENANTSPTPFVAEELSSAIPFASKEPDVFQAEIVVTAGETERKTFTARNGENRRIDYNFGADNQLTVLQTDKHYLIFPKRKIYAEKTQIEGAAATDDWMQFLTTEWLNAKTSAKFEKLETVENITKYRISLDEKTNSEILIYFDETNKLPVRQEFFSVGGEQKVLNFTFELKNLKLQTDEILFVIPTDFRKISEADLRREINKKD